MDGQVATSPYARFEHIDTISELGPEDQPCLDELREVLARHNRLDRIGICLLHQHFELADDEIMMESCDEANRTLSLRPVKRAELDEQDTIVTNWALGGDTALQTCAKKDHVAPFALQLCNKKDH
jgi:hypothetical protein